MLSGGDSTLQIIIKAVDQATGVFKSVQQSLDKHQRSFADTAAASQKFALGLGIAATAAGGLGYAALKAAGDMEQTKIAFETMLGSASKADDFIKQLVSFAKTTPFELKGLNQAAKQLLAYGFAQEEVIPNLKALGDIASGVGMDKLPNLILAYGQVRAATRLTGMELRQFTEAGVPLLGMLAEQMGKPVSAIQEMVTAGEIGFPEVEKALKSLTGEGGRFNDLMAKQATSLGGMVSNLSDAWNMFLAGEGAKLLDWAKKFVQVAQFIITDVLPQWINAIAAIIDFFQQHQIAIHVVAGAIVGALVPAIYAAAVAFGALMLTLAPFIIGGAIIGGIAAGIVWIVKNWELIRGKAVEIWGAIAATVRGAIEAISSGIFGALQAVLAVWQSVWGSIVIAVQTALALIVGTIALFLDWLLPGWQVALVDVASAWVAAWQEISAFVGAIMVTIQDTLTAAFGSIGGGISAALAVIHSVWQQIWGAVRDFFISIWAPIRDAVASALDFVMQKIQAAIDLYNKLIAAISAPVKAVGGALGGVGSAIGSFMNDAINRGQGILRFEQGGVVPGPVGAAVPIIAHGQETILPANNTRRGGQGASYTVNINNPQVRSRADVDYLRTQIEEALRDVSRGHKLAVV